MAKKPTRISKAIPTTTPVVQPAVTAGEIAASGQVLAPESNYVSPNRSGGNTGPIPVLGSGMTYSEIGTSGLRAFSGWVREEFLPSLQGRQAAQKYREMMDNSPIIGAIMFGIIATMRKVEWRVIAANDSPEAQEAAEFLDSCMNDMSHTWEDLIVENLSMLGYGFAPHEIVYKRRLGRDPGMDPARPGKRLARSNYDDGLIGWKRIPIRGQDTVIKWFFDDNGQVEGVTQQPWTGPIIDIPIEKMLLFRPSQHKGNPEGRSILRTAYIPYYYAKRMQEQEAILGERLGGLPVVKVPSTLIDAAAMGDSNALASYNNYKKMAINVRVDEQMGVVLPSDTWPGPNGPSSEPMYSFELITPQGGQGRSLNFGDTIKRYSENQLTSVLADFVSMGHDARGAQNLGETKVDLFYLAIEGFLNSNAAVYNRHGIPRLWRLNGFDLDLMPEVEPDLAQRIDLDALSQFVLRMSQAGMPMFPNDELQQFLQSAAGLPDVVDERAMQAAGLTDDQLSLDDEMARIGLDNMKNPPDNESPKSNLEKMILAGIARRVLKMQGPKFGISTKNRRVGKKGHKHT